MQDKARPSPDQLPATLDFTLVPRKTRRHDGWTGERQRRFIAALAETGSVTAAAKAVNMSHATAYDLYNHPEGASLRAAWDHALSLGAQRLHDIAMERITTGTPSPIFYRGEQVGERRLFNDHLLVQLIRHHAGGYGASPIGHRSQAAKRNGTPPRIARPAARAASRRPPRRPRARARRSRRRPSPAISSPAMPTRSPPSAATASPARSSPPTSTCAR